MCNGVWNAFISRTQGVGKQLIFNRRMASQYYNNAQYFCIFHTYKLEVVEIKTRIAETVPKQGQFRLNPNEHTIRKHIQGDILTVINTPSPVYVYSNVYWYFFYHFSMYEVVKSPNASIDLIIMQKIHMGYF